MTGEIGRGGFVDSLSYLFLGEGSAETFEPFYEASLVEHYPHSSLKEARDQLGSTSRIQLVAESARHSTWIVDQVIRVKGWSEEVIRANSAIWSKRLAAANITWITSAVTTIGSTVYAFAGTPIGTFVFKSFGDRMAQGVAKAAFATLGWPHIALVALIVGSAALWCLASRRYSEAESRLGETQQTAAEDVAEFRDIALLGDFYRAIEHRATPGKVTSTGFIAPQETQWLWMEHVREMSAKFDCPTMQTGAELTHAFTRRNPFDVMERALEGSALATALSDAKSTYQPLAAQLRQIQQLYDMRAHDIRHLAKKNRELIRERRRAAFNVVDGIYWNRVDAARLERDRALRPLQVPTSGLSLEAVREAERAYNNDSRVIAIKARYAEKVRSYDNYRNLAHAAIRGWFNPQIQKEYDKESADLKANHEANLGHLGGYYPTVRALYAWTARVIEAHSQETSPYYSEAIGRAPVVPQVIPPLLPPMQTATQPEEPPSSEMRSWANAGGGLGLDFFLTCAAAGVGFYAAYKASSSAFEQAIADHQNDEAPPAYEEPTPPPPYTPSFYVPPVEPSAPFWEAPPPPFAPPSYEEATRRPEPSAPPAHLVFGEV